MLLEAVLIVAVFGTILVVFLYKYLFQSPEYKAKTAAPPNAEPQPAANLDAEKIAEKVFKLSEKVDDLEADVNNLHLYVSQKVEQSKKKEKPGTGQQ